MKRLVILFVLVLAGTASAQTKYSLVNGCYSVGGSGPLRFHAAALGQYVLYTADGQYLSAAGPAATPGEDAIWDVADDLTVTNSVSHKALGKPVPATGCADFPEVGLDATGTPARGKTPWQSVKGVLDEHAHLMAFDFLGGDFHCGRPWSPLGVTVALPDCASIQGPQGSAAPVQNFLDWGYPEYPHDTVGWPTFNDWPQYHTLSFEQTYYRWIQRAWMGGLRLIETNMVDNEVLCRLLPMHHTDCVDMDAARRQVAYLHQLQDYIDAQSGGPGKGWFRIVTDPFQARKVINQGKLAVVMGIEVSRLFGCGIVNDVPQCSASDIDKGLDEVWRLGVRSFFPIHKFDNAFGGTKMDGGPVGVLINAANREETGAFWSVKTCTGKETDHEQEAPGAQYTALIAGPLAGLAPPGAFPVYPPPPHCNTRGLTDLGKHVLNGMIDRHFLIEIDHMSAKAADEALQLIAARHYSGVMSSHSWADNAQLPEIRALGGSVTPYAGDSAGFVKSWEYDRIHDRTPKYPYGIGYGADMNGLGAQGPPRPGNEKNPVVYPFKSGDGSVTFTRQQSGTHTFDINSDGVAHYGLIPDWLEDLRRIAGPKITHDLFNGAEGYLGMWERADGVPGPSCPAGRVTRRGLGKVRLGARWDRVLFAAGQPWSRPGDAYHWCHGRTARHVGAVLRGGRIALVGVRTGKRGGRLTVTPAGAGRVLIRRGRSVAIARASLARQAKRALAHAGL